jgi:hypothetical protein
LFHIYSVVFVVVFWIFVLVYSVMWFTFLVYTLFWPNPFDRLIFCQVIDFISLVFKPMSFSWPR